MEAEWLQVKPTAVMTQVFVHWYLLGVPSLNSRHMEVRLPPCSQQSISTTTPDVTTEGWRTAGSLWDGSGCEIHTFSLVNLWKGGVMLGWLIAKVHLSLKAIAVFSSYSNAVYPHLMQHFHTPRLEFKTGKPEYLEKNSCRHMEKLHLILVLLAERQQC